MCGTFAGTAKLLHFFKSGSVMPTEAIMSLGIPDDEGNVGAGAAPLDTLSRRCNADSI